MRKWRVKKKGYGDRRLRDDETFLFCFSDNLLFDGAWRSFNMVVVYGRSSSLQSNTKQSFMAQIVLNPNIRTVASFQKDLIN